MEKCIWLFNLYRPEIGLQQSKQNSGPDDLISLTPLRHLSVTSPLPLRYLSVISLTALHIKALSKSYLAQAFNDMGYVRL